MWWLLPFLTLPALAANLDLTKVRELGESLPDYHLSGSENHKKNVDHKRNHRPLGLPVKSEAIMSSGTEEGSISEGALLVRIEDNKSFKTNKQMYVKFYRLVDEQGFKYLVNKDGSTTYKVPSEAVTPIKQELVLYEPPHRYTPAPPIQRNFYDQKLSIIPELTFQSGLVQGDFMADLFNDEEAKSGTTLQFSASLLTEWKMPVKAGVVFNFEKTTYKLTDGGSVDYTSPSFGPLFETKVFDLTIPLRFHAQFRVSPYAKAQASLESEEITFKFNSADLMLAAEHPWENKWGEFNLGLFFQNQWLNIKDQSGSVSLKASNETNKLFGISLSQVFK